MGISLTLIGTPLFLWIKTYPVATFVENIIAWPPLFNALPFIYAAAARTNPTHCSQPCEVAEYDNSHLTRVSRLGGEISIPFMQRILNALTIPPGQFLLIWETRSRAR